MTERERIINIIQKSVDGCAEYWAGKIADGLIENGAIVPSCKVGDKVYQYKHTNSKCSLGEYPSDDNCQGCERRCDSIRYVKLFIGTVIEIKITKDKIWVVADWGEDRWDNSSFEVGKTVFLTREEAETLKEIEKE